MTTIYFGPVINPQSLTSFLALPRCLIAVGEDGNVLWIDNDVDPADLLDTVAHQGLQKYTLVGLKPGEFIMPGLIDTHTHACQFPNLGVGGDLQLLDWLDTYTFPAEAKFGDLDYAKRVYTDVVQRVIACGTTTCCYYGTLHRDSTMLLADIVHKKGQRAFVGKCNMNQDNPIGYLEKSVQESVSATADLIQYIQALPLSPAQEPLVHPIITPRFALSCTPELLAELGRLAEKTDIAIQTHISENEKEVEDTLEYFKADSYACVYDKFKLLRHNTILAHGVWLTEKEMDLIARKGAGISHCPTSNFYLSSGMARVGMLLDRGVKVGLGSDVGGGYNPSILYAIQMASIASKMLAIQAGSQRCSRERRHGHHGHRGHHKHHGHQERHEHQEHHEHHEHHGHHGHRGHHGHSRASPGSAGEIEHHLKHHDHCGSPYKEQFDNKKLGVATLLYLATKGGAEVCCLQDRIGSFERGKAFDALVVSIRNDSGNPAIWGDDIEQDTNLNESHLGQWLERFLFCGDNRNIRKVIVQGTVIGGQEHQA